jgi:predicted RNase H-like nuclease (RuvC/YqgF family)
MEQNYCPAHSGIVQQVDSICKTMEKHDDKIEELNKAVIENNIIIKEFKDAMLEIKEFISENTKTQIKMQNHLANLDKSFKSMEKKVDSLSGTIENNEDLHKIDMRSIQKEQQIKWYDITLKIATPLGFLGLIIYLLTQVIK